MSQDRFGFAHAADWPAIDRDAMIAVDAMMIRDYGITLVQMMENAGRALATLARQRYLPDPQGCRVVVLAGAGGNGGGALAAARRLACWGADVRLVLAQEVSAMTPGPGAATGDPRPDGCAARTAAARDD